MLRQAEDGCRMTDATRKECPGTLLRNEPYLYSEARTHPEKSDAYFARRSRSRHIYRACKPFRGEGARERLSKHLMKLFVEGETDQHRLTVHGLSYLRKLDQEIDSSD
jgi:hypothetical protein